MILAGSLFLSLFTHTNIFDKLYTSHTATMFSDELCKKWKAISENFPAPNEEYDRKTQTRQLISETRF